jgi:polynucleotide 5'-hydroxyl-kinase GRC3/NOL9
MQDLNVPTQWREKTAAILEKRPRVILVLGGCDTGKSSFCRFLATELLACGHSVAIVDADLGQKDIGPPASVTLGRVTGTAERWIAVTEELYFVGSTNPVGRMLPLVIGTTRLVGAANAAFVIVDTTGYIDGAGRVLKGYEIDAVRPDLIVAMEKRDELQPILRSHGTYRTERIRPSPKARPRDRWQRELGRKQAFAAYFREARRLELGVDEIIFQRSLLFTGEPVPVEGALYAEHTPEGVVAVAETSVAGADIAKRLRPGFERNLLCGVTDERDRGVGLALLESIDFGRRCVALSSPVPAEKLRVIQLGDLYLARDGSELGRVDRAGL